MSEGALLTVAASGVLANDVAGADGFTAGGGVVGVRAAGSDLTTDVTTGVGTDIAGLHGTLHLNADGSYTYQSTANNITADTTDVFVYTVKDGDGDLSTTTLTINLANVTLTATDTDALVNEAGLPVIGSDAASNSEIFNGSITPSGGTGPFTYALTSPATRQPRHAGAERRDRDLHLYADHAVRHHAGQHDNGGADRAGQGQLQLHGDRRPGQHRDRHDPGRHHRRRSDGDVWTAAM